MSVLVTYFSAEGTTKRVAEGFAKEIEADAFATSGGSGIGKTANKLRAFVDKAAVVDAKLVRSASELTEWARALKDA